MRIRAALGAAALLLTTGCGVSPGDYIVYRVSLGAETQTDDCYFPAETPPPDLVEDRDSYGQSQTWVIFYAAGDEVMLDAAGVSLRGGSGGDGFEFTADQIDVTYVGIDQQEAKVTAQTTVFVDMKTDGDAISGEIRATTTTTCDFLTAAPSAGLCEQIPDCVRTRSFAGVKLDDVDLQETVDRPNDEIGGGAPPPPGPGPGSGGGMP